MKIMKYLFLKLLITGTSEIEIHFRKDILLIQRFCTKHLSCILPTRNRQYFIAVFQKRSHSDVQERKAKESSTSCSSNDRNCERNISSHAHFCQLFDFIFIPRVNSMFHGAKVKCRCIVRFLRNSSTGIISGSKRLLCFILTTATGFLYFPNKADIKRSFFLLSFCNVTKN